jgi:hypothetical protein
LIQTIPIKVRIALMTLGIDWQEKVEAVEAGGNMGRRPIAGQNAIIGFRTPFFSKRNKMPGEISEASRLLHWHRFLPRQLRYRDNCATTQAR